MGKYTTIDDFITAIVQNFDSNEIVNHILSKITAIISKEKGITFNIIDNTIYYQFKRKNSGTETRKIKVDVENKIITTEETGIKKQNNEVISYENKYNYLMIGTKGINHCIKKQYKLENQKDKNISIKVNLLEKYSYFNQNKSLGLYENIEEKTIIKDENNININNVEKNEQRIEYVLPTGDIIKIETINNETKYYFCSPNQKTPNSFFKEITKQDVDRLLSLDDIYSIINDEMVYELRGSSYN